MMYSFHSENHKGKLRTNNEDYFLNSEIEGGHIFVICDGMGGHNGGEIASKIAANALVDFFKSSKIDNIPFQFNMALAETHRVILSEANKSTSLKGMGTTLVAIIIYNQKCYLAHIGDSRAYAIFDDQMISLTKDHSLVQHLIDAGELTEKEAQSHPRRNVITKALGTSFDSKDDYFDGEISLPENSYLLLCTDGLNGMINDQEILEAFTLKDPERIAESLIQKALEAGGNDNITVSVLKVESSNSNGFSHNTKFQSKPKKHGILKFINRLK